MALTTKDLEPRAIVSTDVSAETHAALKEIARRNQRSVAGELRFLLEEHVAKHQEEVPRGA